MGLFDGGGMGSMVGPTSSNGLGSAMRTAMGVGAIAQPAANPWAGGTPKLSVEQAPMTLPGGPVASAQNPYGSNPWGDMVGSDSMAAINGTKQAQSTMGALNNMAGNYGGAEGGYPAMENSYGLGSPTQSIPGSSSNPGYQTQPINLVMPESSSRGFNPWSLQGESNARGK